jgi:hypothetical protein
MTQKIDINKKYRTESGLEVVLYTTEGLDKTHPVIGEIIINSDKSFLNMWTLQGHGECNLVEVKPRIKRTVWVNVYTYQHSEIVHPSHEVANREAVKGRLACVKVEIDCEEGEGL